MLTRAQITPLAPDEASLSAAESLAASRAWVTLARSDRALWAEIHGSGKTPYRVCADISATSNRCTCPSRKHPCKHVLALLLRAADAPDAINHAEEPSWVLPLFTAKLKHPATEPPIAKRADDTARAADRAKRAAKREQRITDGVAECRVWLDDLLSEGLAAARTRPSEFWERPAARLVDAQAPGLARCLRRLRDAVIAPGDWASRGLERAASLHLLLRAHERLAEIPEPLRHEVRSRIGWTITKEEVLASERVRDTWVVVGAVEEQDDRLRVRRTWLWGTQTAQEAVVLDYTIANRAFGPSPPVGAAFEGMLAFYPGARRCRALIDEQTHAPWPANIGDATFDQALARHAEALAADPWVESTLAIVRDVRFLTHDGAWVVADREGAFLPLVGDPPWRAVAIGGGQPIAIAAEYDGHDVRPMSVWAGATVWPLGTKP